MPLLSGVPGKGICRGDCMDASCVEARVVARTICPVCEKQIGYGTSYTTLFIGLGPIHILCAPSADRAMTQINQENMVQEVMRALACERRLQGQRPLTHKRLHGQALRNLRGVGVPV